MVEPNPYLAAIPPFSGRKGASPGAVYLDRNEQMDPFPAAVFSALKDEITIADLMLYPDVSPLVERLGQQLALPEACISVTAGSDAGIRALFQAYLRPDDVVVTADPSYAMYDIAAALFQARTISLPYEADLDLDLDRFVALIAAERPRVVALANPDQPTGHTFTATELRRIAEAARAANSLFIIDEAYHHYWGEDALALLRIFDNIAITRTFSKAGGLAGARLGYVVSSLAIANAVGCVRALHDVSAISIRLGCYLLDHPEILEKHRTAVEGGRSVLLEMAKRLGLACPPCPTNFQLLRFPDPDMVPLVMQGLEERGYFVKGRFTAPALRDCVRVTLAGPDTIRSFSTALQTVYHPVFAVA